MRSPRNGTRAARSSPPPNELLPESRQDYSYLARKVIFEYKAGQGGAERSILERGPSPARRAGPALAGAGHRVDPLPYAQEHAGELYQALGSRPEEEVSQRDRRRAGRVDGRVPRLRDRVSRPRQARQAGRRLPEAHHALEVPPRGHRASRRFPQTPSRGVRAAPEAGQGGIEAAPRLGLARTCTPPISS